jgi:hypothetical protein
VKERQARASSASATTTSSLTARVLERVNAEEMRKRICAKSNVKLPETVSVGMYVCTEREGAVHEQPLRRPTTPMPSQVFYCTDFTAILASLLPPLFPITEPLKVLLSLLLDKHFVIWLGFNLRKLKYCLPNERPTGIIIHLHVLCQTSPRSGGHFARNLSPLLQTEGDSKIPFHHSYKLLPPWSNFSGISQKSADHVI